MASASRISRGGWWRGGFRFIPFYNSMLDLTVQTEDAASGVLRGVMARVEDAEGLHEAVGTTVHPGPLRAQPCWQLIRMNAAELDRFLRAVQKDGYTVRRDAKTGQWLRAGDSWTDNPRAAARYADLDEATRRDRWSVMLEIAGSETGDAFKEIGELVQAFQPLVRKKLNPPVASEAEWVFRIGRRLVDGSPKRDAKRRVVTLTLSLP